MSLDVYPGITRTDFVEIAAGLGDAAAVGHLVGAQLALSLARLELVRRRASQRFVDECAQARFADALALLHVADVRDRPATAAVLSAATTGAWVASCAALLHSDAPSSSEVAASLAHLWAIAAAAAVRAGVEFECAVPAYDGLVVLPTVGGARVEPMAAAGTRVRVAGDELTAGSVMVDLSALGREAAGWLPVWTIEASADGLPLRVQVDDLDPYRATNGLQAAGRLTADDVEALRAQMVGAWSILVSRHRPYADGIRVALTSLVPLTGYPKNHGVSAAFRHAAGAVALTAPDDATSLAVTMLHESQHIKLNRVLDLVDLHLAGPDPRYRAPWRDDPRPLEGLMQGAYAFAGVTDFWRVERIHRRGRHRRSAEFEFARWRGPVVEVLDTIIRSATLTAAGELFFTTLRERLSPWGRDVVADDVAALAEQAAIDDDACWRLRHGRVDPLVVAAMASRRGFGPAAAAAPTSLSAAPGGTGRANHGRQDLVALRLREPDRFARAVRDPAVLSAEMPAASAADLAYARGDAEAEALYLACVEADPERVEAWVGLAMALRRRGVPELLTHLELAYAVHRHLRAEGAGVCPTEITAWLSAGTP